MIETRKFTDLWNSGAINKGEFARLMRGEGISDSTVYKWTSGIARPSTGNRIIISMILKKMGINTAKGQYLF